MNIFISILAYSIPIVIPILIGLIKGVKLLDYFKDPTMLISGFLLSYLGSLTIALISKSTQKNLIKDQHILKNKLSVNQFVLGELIQKIHSGSSLLMHHAKQIQNLLPFIGTPQIKSVKDAHKGILDCCSDLDETANSLRTYIKD